MPVSDRRLISHHVGARAGTRALDLPERFDPDVVNVLYEADPAAVPAIEAAWAERGSETIVMATALAEQDGEGTLRLFRDRYMSSFLDLEPALAEAWWYDRQFNWANDPAARTVDAAPVVRTGSLDGLVEAGLVPPPDILSLDTQGTELSVLNGAQRVLGGTLLVETECELIPAYRGAGRFEQVRDFMLENGFDLIGLEPIGLDLAARQLPVGTPGVGRPIWAELRFLKQPERISSAGDQLAKLAFLALRYLQMPALVVALDRLEAASWSAGEETPLFRRLVDELLFAWREWPRLYSVPFSVIVPPGSAEARFTSAFTGKGDPDEMMASIFADIEPAVGVPALVRFLDPAPIGLEVIAADYGLTDQAAWLGVARQRQAAAILMRLGVLNEQPDGGLAVDAEAAARLAAGQGMPS